MKNLHDALRAVDCAWPQICTECTTVLGSELHYQAMIYHALRSTGHVPFEQLGMNVKQWIPNARTEHFRRLAERNDEGYRVGFEPIPDVVIFSSDVGADWRRRRYEHTISCMLAVIEVKASERARRRLTRAEVCGDIRKLAAHRDEVSGLGHDFHPIMLVIDSAREAHERMTAEGVSTARDLARDLGVEWRYVSLDGCHVVRPARQ